MCVCMRTGCGSPAKILTTCVWRFSPRECVGFGVYQSMCLFTPSGEERASRSTDTVQDFNAIMMRHHVAFRNILVCSESVCVIIYYCHWNRVVSISTVSMMVSMISFWWRDGPKYTTVRDEKSVNGRGRRLVKICEASNRAKAITANRIFYTKRITVTIFRMYQNKAINSARLSKQPNILNGNSLKRKKTIL